VADVPRLHPPGAEEIAAIALFECDEEDLA
jgi:hypothetical protein